MTDKINLDKENLSNFEKAVKEMNMRGIIIDFQKKDINGGNTFEIIFGESWANPIFQLGFWYGKFSEQDNKIKEENKTKLTEFKVVSVSANTNSFGLHGVVICDKEGNAFEIGVGQIYLPKRGDVITGELNAVGQLLGLKTISYEIPRKMQTPSAKVIKEIWEIKSYKDKHVDLNK